MSFEALEIVAQLVGPIVVPRDGLAIDSLLAAAVALRDQIAPVGVGPLVDIEIPVQKSACGRYHMASVCYPVIDEYERRWLNRRFPIEQAQTMGGLKLRRIQLTAGPTKSYRIPYEVGHVERDELRWWIIGEADEIRALLSLIDNVSKKRSVGLGRVAEWRVRALDEGERWAGFPIIRDGAPLRPLPPDTAGLTGARCDLRLATMTYPYWLYERRELCAVPLPG